MQNDTRGSTTNGKGKTIPAALLVVIAVFLVYVQVVTHEFISYDDGIYVTNNECVKAGITLENVQRAFSLKGCSSRTYYHPVTWLSHMLDIQFYGLKPGLHHLTNVLLHVLNVALLFAILLLATRSPWPSLITAALFGLHPINVDSVAWLAERKNILSTTFWMLTLLAYIRYTERRKAADYALVVVAFAAGLLAKPTIVALPAVLLLMDFWPLKRAWLREGADGKAGIGNLAALIDARVPVRALVLEKLPLLAMSAISVYIANLSLHSAVVPTSLVPMTLRLENALAACTKYLWKMLLPIDLTFFYPYPASVPAWKAAAAAGFLLAVTYFALKQVFRRPYILFGWLWFLGTIFPVLGIMQGGQWPEIAERWAYIPLIGIYLVIGWGSVEIFDRLKGTGAGYTALGAFAAVIVLLACLTWTQIGYWKNDYLLYTHGIEVNPDNFVAHNNLGKTLMGMDRIDGAISHFSRAVSISPDFPEANYNLGVAYLRQKKDNEALTYLARAIQLNPNDADAYLSLGVSYLEQGNPGEALTAFGKALQISPDSPEVNFNLGMAYHLKGDIDEAIKSFSRAVQIDPNYTEAHYNLGVMFILRADRRSAIEHFSRAIALDPRHKEAHYNLGRAYLEENRAEEARAEFSAAIAIDPGFAPAREQLEQGTDGAAKLEATVKGLEKVLEEKPGNLETLNRLAVYYALLGRNDKAMACLNEIVRIRPESPDAYYNMACIFAKEGKIDESVASLNRAVRLGFRNRKLLETDGDLRNVRSTEQYKRLLEGMAP